MVLVLGSTWRLSPVTTQHWQWSPHSTPAMKLSLARYRSMLTVQYTFLLVDLLINTFAELFRFESVILLVIFV